MDSVIKYLLCRPRGGLNDTLCQIEHCWSYCEKYKRILIIDTKRSGIFVDFSELFMNNTDSVTHFKLTEDILSEINNLDCQIKEINGKIDTYQSEFKKGLNYVLAKTEIKLTFDFDKDHNHKLLIYEQCGGGTNSLNLLNRLKLSTNLKNKFLENKIDDKYQSIHVRNTDYKTNYEKLLYELKEHLKGENVLVCSDDIEVIEESKKILYQSKIISKTSNDFSDKGKPLHSTINNYSQEQKMIITTNSIIDLLLLASSERIHYSNLSNYNFYVLSGFTKLAVLLSENKNILKNLIS